MAVNTQKLLPASKLTTAERMSASYDRRIDDILNFKIKEKLIDVDKFFKNKKKKDEKKVKKRKEEKKRKGRSEREKNLETPKGIKGVEKVKSLIPKTGILDAVQRFATFTFLGYLLGKFGGEAPKLLGILKNAGPIVNTTEKIIGGIFEGIVGFIDSGYKAHDQMRSLSKDIGGEKAQKVYDDFSSNFNRFLNAVLTFGLSELGRGDGKPPEKKSDGGMVRGYARGGQTTRGGRVVGGAVGRTFRAQRISRPQKVQPEKVSPGKDVGGKLKIEKLYPNPKPSAKRQPNPYKALTGVSESLDKGGWIGQLMSAGVKVALGQKVNTGRIARSVSGGMSSLSQAEQGGIDAVSRSILGMADGGLIPIIGGNRKVTESVLNTLIQNRVNDALRSVTEELIKVSGGLTSRGGGAGPGSSFMSEIEYGPITMKMDQKQAFATIYELAKKNGDPMPELTAAQAMLESGYLSSPITKNLNNPFGQKGTGNRGSDGGFAAYNSLEDAVKDHIKLWQNNYGKYRGMGTYGSPMEGLRANIEAYAPASENDQAQYLKNVAGILATMGFDPDSKNSLIDLSSKALIQQRRARPEGTSRISAGAVNPITGNNGKLKEKDMIVVGSFQSDYPQAWYGSNAMLLSEAGQAFNAAVAAAAKEGIDLRGAINSAYRSYEHQEVIVGKYPIAAAPGTSQHGEGKALDINTNSPAFEWLKRNGPKYGWHWAQIPGDDVHFEYKGGFKPEQKKPKPKPESKPEQTTKQIEAQKRLQSSLKKARDEEKFRSRRPWYDKFGWFGGAAANSPKPKPKPGASAAIGLPYGGNMQGGGLVGPQNKRNYSPLSMYPSYDTSGGTTILIQPMIVEKQIPVPMGSSGQAITFPIPVGVNNNMASLSR